MSSYSFKKILLQNVHNYNTHEYSGFVKDFVQIFFKEANSLYPFNINKPTYMY